MQRVQQLARQQSQLKWATAFLNTCIRQVTGSTHLKGQARQGQRMVTECHFMVTECHFMVAECHFMVTECHFMVTECHFMHMPGTS